MRDFPHSVPVLSCAEAKLFEKEFFARPGAASEESAMDAAGTGVGNAVLRIFCGNGCRGNTDAKSAAAAPISRLLVLAGKGHNGGDAVCAAERIFSQTACRVVFVFFAKDESALAPLTRKFLERFCAAVPAEKRTLLFLPANVPAGALGEIPAELAAFAAAPRLVILDGIFGHSFRPPFPPAIRAFAEKIFALRAADSAVCSVDLPSGLCDAICENAPEISPENFAVCADFTFPTGILKTPISAFPRLAGRVVPVNIGFAAEGVKSVSVRAAAVCDEAFFLRKIFAPRPVVCDKRNFGHVLIVGGSRAMPGALMLNALAALRAGAGLVSVICPQSVQPAFAARAPGAMWIPCAENSEGGLDCAAAFAQFEKMLPRVSAVLCGSGAGTSADTQALIQKIAARTPAGTVLVLDADALRAGTLAALRERRAPAEKTILLPHTGEFARLGGNADFDANFGGGNASALREFCAQNAALVALKGVCTRVAGPNAEFLTFAGTPALARGGSGDVLAGIVAALFASPRNLSAPAEPNAETPPCAEERLAAAVIWHGNAARRLAAAQGERCADISALPSFLF